MTKLTSQCIHTIYFLTNLFSQDKPKEDWQEKLVSTSPIHRTDLQLTQDLISKQHISHKDCLLNAMVSGSFCLLTLKKLSKLSVLHLASVFISTEAGTPKGVAGKLSSYSCSSSF